MIGIGGIGGFGVGRAKGDGGHSLPPPTPLDPPSGQAIASGGSQEVIVTWNDPGSVPYAIQVNIYVTPGDALIGSQGVSAGVQTASFPGLTPGLIVYAGLYNIGVPPTTSNSAEVQTATQEVPA